jgi:A/G-specific adenine glycosylase
VLGLWSGLGYYARARHLLACAQKIMTDHGGAFPETAAVLSTLPGIGPSTAGAIAATVFHERAAILDGNVKRVLARLTCAEAPWGSPALERALWAQARVRLPRQAAQMPAYTQAIMDLGATVCRPRAPACERCPVQRYCLAFEQQRVADYPRPKQRRAVPERSAAWCVALDDQGVWLLQRPSPGIWGGLWTPWELDLQSMPPGWKKTVLTLREVIEITHTFTHFRLKISAGIFVSKTIDSMPPRGAPAGMKKFAWEAVFSQPLPAPVKQLLLRLCPSGPESDGEPRKHSRH